MSIPLKNSFPTWPKKYPLSLGNETCRCAELFPSQLYLNHSNNLFVGGNTRPIPISDNRAAGFDCDYQLFFEFDPPSEDPIFENYAEFVYIVFDNPSNWFDDINEGDPNDIRQWIINFNNSFPINTPMLAFPANTNPCDPQGDYFSGADSAQLSFLPFD